MPQVKKSAPKITAKVKAVGGKKVEVSKDVFHDLNGLVKENYLIGLDSAHSLLEENKRLMDAQIEQLRKIQTDYTEHLKSTFDKLPKEYSDLGIVAKLDRLIEFQNNFYSAFKKISDNYSKEMLDISQKSAERAFTAFDKYVGSFAS